MLTWTRNGKTREAHYGGRMRYSLERQKYGWVLMRWRLLADGLQMSGKESVSSLAFGKQYADNLHVSTYGKEIAETTK